MPRYSDIPAVRQLAALLQSHAITRFVLCPGSRNSPLVSTLSQLPHAECRAITDERSAGFVALGWIQQAQAPVAVVVTSGSAALNLHPAVAEASYQQLPLLIISADRPCAWIDQQDGQTLKQRGIYGSLVRACVHLPEGDSAENAWHRNRLINEACLALHHRTAAPAHINIPLTDPLLQCQEGELEAQRIIRRIEFASMGADEEGELVELIKKSPKRMILVGQHPLAPALCAELQEKGFVIVAEHLGNCAALPGAITLADKILGKECPAHLAPDLLITLGGCIVSKRIKRLLRKHSPQLHWHISRDGALIDTFRCLSHCLEGEPEELWDIIATFADSMEDNSAAADYYLEWQDAASNIPLIQPEDLPYGAPRIVGELLAQLPPQSVLHLANSSAVRYAQLYPLPEDVEVLCNRGVNGIEGSLSCALGYACQSDKTNVLLIGDLSFFYDMNALSMAVEAPPLLIILLNNGGGGIFASLPGVKEQGPAQDYILGRHQQSAELWAQSCQVDYHAVHNIQDWQQIQSSLVQAHTRSRLVEVFCHAELDAATLATLLQ